jgi:hypothetical protein
MEMGVVIRFTHELATRINRLPVIPAKAGIQLHISWRAVISSWISAFAGMTEKKLNDLQVAALYLRGETSGSGPISSLPPLGTVDSSPSGSAVHRHRDAMTETMRSASRLTP